MCVCVCVCVCVLILSKPKSANTGNSFVKIHVIQCPIESSM